MSMNDRKELAVRLGVEALVIAEWEKAGLPVENPALAKAWLSVHQPEYVGKLLGVSTPPGEGVNLESAALGSVVERYRQLEYWAWEEMKKAQLALEGVADDSIPCDTLAAAVVRAVEKYRDAVSDRIKMEARVSPIMAHRRERGWGGWVKRLLWRILDALYIRKLNTIGLIPEIRKRGQRRGY